MTPMGARFRPSVTVKTKRLTNPIIRSWKPARSRCDDPVVSLAECGECGGVEVGIHLGNVSLGEVENRRMRSIVHLVDEAVEAWKRGEDLSAYVHTSVKLRLPKKEYKS